MPDSLFLGDECKQAVAAGIPPAAVMSCLREGDLPQVDIMDGFAFISFTTMESMNGRRADGRRWDLLSGVPSKALSLRCLFRSRASAGTRLGGRYGPSRAITAATACAAATAISRVSAAVPVSRRGHAVADSGLQDDLEEARLSAQDPGKWHVWLGPWRRHPQ